MGKKKISKKSIGIYASYNLEHFDVLERTLSDFMTTHNPQVLVARDSLHNLKSW